MEITKKPDWQTKALRRNQTIQFPNNYEGGINIGFEGNAFRKTREVNKIDFYYSYDDFGLGFNEYGDTVSIPIHSSVIGIDRKKTIILSNSKEYCRGNQIEGILYYNKEVEASATYYIKFNSFFRESMTVHFPNIELEEVENVIKTIPRTLQTSSIIILG